MGPYRWFGAGMSHLTSSEIMHAMALRHLDSTMHGHPMPDTVAQNIERFTLADTVDAQPLNIDAPAMVSPVDVFDHESAWYAVPCVACCTLVPRPGITPVHTCYAVTGNTLLA